MLWAQKSVVNLCHSVRQKIATGAQRGYEELLRPVHKNKKSMEENVVDNCPFHDPNSV